MRVGILGAGGMGNVHAWHLGRMAGVELLFFESDVDRRAQFESVHRAKSVQSLEELLADCDVIDLCLPTDLHEEYAMRTLQAGKPTFIEKPVADCVAAGRRIAEAAKAHGARVGVGQVVRYFPEFREARAAVKQGKIGTPAAARTRRGGAMPTRAWFGDHSRSGGVLVDLAVHDFDWLRWTLGEVREVFAQSVGAETMEGPDYALTTLSFVSGAVAHVEATWMDPGGSRVSFEICGSGGMIEYDSRAASTVRTAVSGRSAIEAPLSPTDDPFYQELRDFLNSVEEGREPPVTIEEGIKSLQIAEAAWESAKTRKPVQLCS